MSESNNPFLVGNFEPSRFESATTYNPFSLSTATAVTDSSTPASTSSTSNPFLSGFGASAVEATPSPATSDCFGQQSSPSPFPTNPFAQFLSGSTNATGTNAIFATSTDIPSLVSRNDGGARYQPPQPVQTRGSIDRRTSLGYESDTGGKRSPPRRPPPPRPSRPGTAPPTPGPPSETKDLIQSVTEALDATSTDLLDRLQATRTPSPIPMRDIVHTPSPTHDSHAPIVNDLFLGETGQNRLPQHGLGHKEIQQEAMNIFDAIANLSREDANKSDITAPPISHFQPPTTYPASVPPAHPPPPPAPHRPPPPQVPESPFMSRKSSIVSATSSRRSSVDHQHHREPPPPLPPPPALREPSPPIQPPPTTPAQSYSLADLPKPSTLILNQTSLPTGYSPMRKASHDITSLRMQPIMPAHKKYSLDYGSNSAAEQAAMREKLQQLTTIISPSTSEDPPMVDTSPAAEAMSKEKDNTPILETPKFPSVMSTTPLVSCENIANEQLYETSEHSSPFSVPAPDTGSVQAELGLVFDEAIEVVTAATVEKTSAIPVVNPTAAPPCAVSTPDPFAVNSVSPEVAVPVDHFVTGMNVGAVKDDFDEFDQMFDNVKQNDSGAGDGFSTVKNSAFDPFGDSVATNSVDGGFAANGFGNEDTFDAFLAMNPPQLLPEEQKPTFEDQLANTEVEYGSASQATAPVPPTSIGDRSSFSRRISKTESTGTPQTPLFDDDISQPLEPFPRTEFKESGWNMQMRYPIRKKFTGQRFWKKVFVRLVYQGDTPHLEVLSKDDNKETLLHEWPLQPCYAISEIGAQQYDQFGKIFTVKVQFVVYKERPGVRPGQVTKAERLTNKLSQFAAYAIQGDYQGVKEFGSDLKKLGLPVEHSPQISLICKLGSHNYEDMKRFSSCVEEALFRLSVHRDNIHINYKMEEVQITAVDELYVEQNAAGSIIKQIARVRLFFLGFLTGNPDVEIGVNDLRRQGKEVVGRHDIIPVVTEEWIRLEDVEFHACVQQDVYEETKTIKIKPPDQCYLELMRFRVRPPRNRELPLQVKTTFKICGNKVDIYSDVLVPGFTSRKLGQIPCEDVVIRIPIPECWIYLFRTEKHFRYGSVKSAHRRTGKIKGIERFLGAVDTLEQHLIEVTSGQAKYEHHHRAIVWRMSRLPKEGQGAYTTHNLVSHLALTSYDQIPEELAKHCFVEFTMPITQVSHTTVRSVSICNSDSDSPPEKYVRHLARHEYMVEITETHTECTNDYLAATITKPKIAESRSAPPSTAASKKRLESVPDSESDSD